MTRGVDTPENVVAEFRAHYLYSGNASESARKVGLNENTGRDLARKLVSDEEFAAARRALRASALEELVAMRLRVAQKALDRFEGELPEPAPAAEGMPAPVVIDKRADYGKLVLEAEKNAHALAKLDSGSGDEQGGTTEVHIHLAPGAEGDGEPKA